MAACGDKSGSKPTLKNMDDSFAYAFGGYSGSMLHNFKIKEVNWEIFKAALEQGLKNGDSSLAMNRETIGRILNNYTIEAKCHYLINPIYKYKFGWQPKKQFWVIKQIPFIRNFFTTCVYYLIRK